MGLKDLFFGGDTPFAGVQDGGLARAMLLASLGQGLMGAVNNNAPGGIDMSSMGRGVSQGLQQLVQLQQQEAAKARDERDFMARGEAQAFTEEMALRKLEDEKLRRQAVIDAANAYADDDPEIATYEQAENFLSRRTVVDNPVETKRGVLARDVVKGPDGQLAVQVMYDDGEIEVKPYSPGYSPYEPPGTPYVSLQPNPEGGQSAVAIPRGKGYVGDPQVTPVEGVVDPSPPKPEKDEEAEQFARDIRRLAGEYRSERNRILREYPFGDPEQQRLLDALNKQYDPIWPAGFSPLDPSTWGGATSGVSVDDILE